MRAFTRLAGLGRPGQLAQAWEDHREDVPGTLEDATQEANYLIARLPDLLVREEYSTVVTACDQCENVGPFRRAAPNEIVNILGYW